MFFRILTKIRSSTIWCFVAGMVMFCVLLNRNDPIGDLSRYPIIDKAAVGYLIFMVVRVIGDFTRPARRLAKLQRLREQVTFAAGQLGRHWLFPANRKLRVQWIEALGGDQFGMKSRVMCEHLDVDQASLPAEEFVRRLDRYIAEHQKFVADIEKLDRELFIRRLEWGQQVVNRVRNIATECLKQANFDDYGSLTSAQYFLAASKDLEAPWERLQKAESQGQHGDRRDWQIIDQHDVTSRQAIKSIRVASTLDVC